MYVSVVRRTVWTHQWYEEHDHTVLRRVRPGAIVDVYPDGAECALRWPHLSVDGVGNVAGSQNVGGQLQLRGLPAGGTAGWTQNLGNESGGSRAGNLAPVPAGGVYALWMDGTTARASRRLADGSLAPGWTAGGDPVSGAALMDDGLALAPDGLEQALACWSEQHGTADLHVALLAPGGVAPWFPAGGAPVSGAPGDQRRPAAAVAAPGQVVVAWEDGRDPATGPDVYAQRVVTGVPTAVLASVVEASAGEGRVRIRWQVSGETPAALRVGKAGADGRWSEAGLPTNEGAGMLSFSDSDVSAGQRFGYRLQHVAETGLVILGETWIDVPASAAFALERMGPAVAAGDFTLRAWLPDGARAVAECYDAHGRLRWTQGCAGTGGALSLQVPTAEWEPGVYWVRLRDGSRARTIRCVLLR